MPLAIDPMYGSSSGLLLSDFKADYKLGKFQTEKPLIDRLTLHAYQIELPPIRSQNDVASDNGASQPNCFVAGLDKKFKAAIKMLTKYNPKGPMAFLNQDDFEKILTGQRLE
jgi:23S rRNA pseudouridine955/2504/2580 synthase/23S rRNA pseudouridine1911/1915/1917 synthase